MFVHLYRTRHQQETAGWRLFLLDHEADQPDAVSGSTQECVARVQASLFLFPSLTETFGNVTIEAMASGLPLLAFNDAAAGQLVTHDLNGLLAPPPDPAEFCRLATELGCNPGLRQRLGREARQKALQLGWDNIVQRIEDLYAASIAKAHASTLPRVWAGVRPT